MNILKKISTSFLVFVFFVTPFFVNATAIGTKDYDDGLSAATYNDKASNASVQAIIIKVIKWLLGILAALAVMVLIIAGMMYILSGGDEGRVSTAKTWIIYAIIGLIVALLGWVIVNLVTNLVEGK